MIVTWTIINQVALREIVAIGENLQEAVDSSETRCRWCDLMSFRPLSSRSSAQDLTSSILLLSSSNEEMTSLLQVVSIAINAWGWARNR